MPPITLKDREQLIFQKTLDVIDKNLIFLSKDDIFEICVSVGIYIMFLNKLRSTKGNSITFTCHYLHQVMPIHKSLEKISRDKCDRHVCRFLKKFMETLKKFNISVYFLNSTYRYRYVLNRRDVEQLLNINVFLSIIKNLLDKTGRELKLSLIKLILS